MLAPFPDARRRSLPLRVLAGLARLAFSASVIAIELARPLYRPLYEALARLAVVRRLEAAVAGLPRHAILTLLAVPFIGVEPLKLLGVVWMAEGHRWSGLAMLVFAYLAGFVLVERIYSAGRDKLLTIAWFAALVGWGVRVRERALDRLRATRAWRAAVEGAARARAVALRLLGRRPAGAA